MAFAFIPYNDVPVSRTLSRMAAFKLQITAAFFLLLAVIQPLEAAPKLLASIRPLHSWLSYLTEGITEPELLIQSRRSPHLYHLKPSDFKRMRNADVIFWIGPSLESNLLKPFSALNQSQIITLLDDTSLHTLASREGGLHEWHQHTHHEIDPHFWLSINNVISVSEKMAMHLQTIDPDNAAHYKRNAANLKAELIALDQQVKVTLAPIQTIPFLVAHDAFQYLEHDYQLNAIGSLFIHPERKPGARRLIALRKYLNSQSVCCIFSDSTSDDSIVNSLLEETRIQLCPLDPLGLTLEPGKKLYFDLMRKLSGALLHCLEANKEDP